MKSWQIEFAINNKRNRHTRNDLCTGKKPKTKQQDMLISPTMNMQMISSFKVNGFRLTEY